MKMTLTIVALLFISPQGIAQSTEDIKAILKENGIEAERCYGVNANGALFITTMVEINKISDVRPSRVYLYTTDKQFSEVTVLNGYVVFGYSPKKNQLLIGKYNIRPDRSSTCQVFYTYDIESMTFTLQYDLEHENHSDQFGEVKYTKGYDSILIPYVRFGFDDYRNVIRKVK